VVLLKALILCYSYHHQNTQKVASVIANILGAEVKSPKDVTPQEVAGYDLVGFGSGIYFGKHHKTLLNIADKLPSAKDKPVFIFSTSGEEGKGDKLNTKMRKKLQAKGYHILSEFNCPGYDTTIAAKLFGSQQEGRPNKADLAAAQTFAENIKRTYNVLLLCEKNPNTQ
jgi:flavodoxin